MQDVHCRLFQLILRMLTWAFWRKIVKISNSWIMLSLRLMTSDIEHLRIWTSWSQRNGTLGIVTLVIMTWLLYHESSCVMTWSVLSSRHGRKEAGSWRQAAREAAGPRTLALTATQHPAAADPDFGSSPRVQYVICIGPGDLPMSTKGESTDNMTIEV